jgi:hypothetical protein
MGAEADETPYGLLIMPMAEEDLDCLLSGK